MKLSQKWQKPRKRVNFSKLIFWSIKRSLPINGAGKSIFWSQFRQSFPHLPDTDNGIGDQNEQNDKRLDKCGNRFIIIFKESENERNNSGKQKNFD